jgi:hypothetical protein
LKQLFDVASSPAVVVIMAVVLGVLTGIASRFAYGARASRRSWFAVMLALVCVGTLGVGLAADVFRPRIAVAELSIGDMAWPASYLVGALVPAFCGWFSKHGSPSSQSG